MDSPWLSADLWLDLHFVLQLVVYPQRVGQHLLSSHPSRFFLARRVVYPAVPCHEIFRGHWRRFYRFLHLHADGRRVPVFVGDISYPDEPLPTFGTFLPAIGHAGCGALYIRRPCFGNIHGVLV